ncbi:glycosyl transferase (plasmid) [Methylobacterium currus]|uniref:Glycosyl transferase n=1 Tax=Methylobacterium currus TaxID=2051553 RepID=A0A2R4WWY5_9HYPH|nr:glycosyltransferase [Methylobacterium currus]AWB26057.1 glycosyl transferase [Methylobacterium currus]
MTIHHAPALPTLVPQLSHRPRLSIIIPIFRHSGLVREAMYSLTQQAGFTDVDVIFVDDGCPDPQTYATLTFFSNQWVNVHYIRQFNSGLSAARNRGISFTLKNIPEVEAIYFLDADNFLAPYSIFAMQEALISHPDADWFYPDVRMFGFRVFNDYSGSFNAYAASVINICEAGSLIRRRMVESDLRFDETMRLGYEDWDFWLSAIERGFRGRHLPSLGLSYRKRAESMLADSGRSDSQIREYMRRKHDLFQINTFVQLEHQELPRFAVCLSDEALVEMATDLQQGGSRMPWQTFETRVWQAIREPTFVSAGQYILTTTDRTLNLLRRTGLMRWLSIEIEQALTSHNFVSLTIVASEDNAIRVRRDQPFREGSHLFGTSWSLMQAIALDSSDTWIRELLEYGESYRIACIEVSLPGDIVSPETLKDLAASDFIQTCLHVRRNDMRGRPSNVVEDVFLGSRALNDMMPRARAQFDNAMLPPIAEAREGRIAMVLPHCDFGGVEKVTFCLSRELRRQGFRTSLILLGANAVYRAGHAIDAFDDIHIIDTRDRVSAWSGASFLGTQVPTVLNDQWARDFVNFLSTFETVISCHSAEILGLFSSLRRREVVTATYLHLFDKSLIGGYCGHPTLALAYEHAIDLVLTCSDTMATEVTGLGIPRMKILSLPNAPSLLPNGSGELPVRPPVDRPIRVLYLGRLDTQKGLDRLASIFDVIGHDPDFDVRVIGKSILTDGNIFLNRHASLVEPPIYDDADLSAAYSWADVLLLPSRYEGLPLTVLEAMAHGVVPIVAACGAVAEAVETEVSGFIVPQDRCVEDTIDHLRTLAADRNKLGTMSREAMTKVASRPWSILAEQVRERLETLRAAGRTAKAARAAALRATA